MKKYGFFIISLLLFSCITTKYTKTSQLPKGTKFIEKKKQFSIYVRNANDWEIYPSKHLSSYSDEKNIIDVYNNVANKKAVIIASYFHQGTKKYYIAEVANYGFLFIETDVALKRYKQRKRNLEIKRQEEERRKKRIAILKAKEKAKKEAERIKNLSRNFFKTIHNIKSYPGYKKAIKLLLNDLKASDLYSILKEDVFGYDYSLKEEYSTELKKKVFMKSADYRNRLNSIKKLKKYVKKHRFAIFLQRARLSNYNLAKKGFYFSWGQNSGRGWYNSVAPMCYDNFYLAEIGVKAKKTPKAARMFGVRTDNSRFLFENSLFIPVSEKKAIAIENVKNEISIKLEFNVAGTKDVSFPYLNFAGSASWVLLEHKTVVAINITLFVSNSENELIKIQYNK